MTDFQKKEEIANHFMKYFRKFGMKHTIVDDGGKSLGVSKKPFISTIKMEKRKPYITFSGKLLIIT